MYRKQGERYSTMKKAIWFDMDGTLANFYGVAGWLEALENEEVKPYAEAKALINLSALARILNRLAKNGYEINIVSWTSKEASADFCERIAIAKREWLKKHLASVAFNNIDIIPYGEPKSANRNGILFDDEAQNRKEWGENAYTEKEIFEILKAL